MCFKNLKQLLILSHHSKTSLRLPHLYQKPDFYRLRSSANFTALAALAGSQLRTTNQGRNQPATNQQSHEMTVPNELIGCIIGKVGYRIMSNGNLGVNINSLLNLYQYFRPLLRYRATIVCDKSLSQTL